MCDGQNCRVCTAKVIRATFNEGETESNNLTLVSKFFGETWDNDYTVNVRVACVTSPLTSVTVSVTV